ncbi:hypothetical protein [Agrobacterium vitis]|uniref:hypothetical protein n=1 Tax=Agrobacterium vitis TaxID=373 RepID=UPI0012EA1F70|nr:hypothetical protein [Agrobacterium vitis]MCE6077957.1 hypothetical protein [Agrobacterium vitis]MCM2453296.1 hypothetical protein [Agrobacterium vitis]MCM2470581.1 hypothetical protein [Agrobacterium vitis]MUO86628.1 hypothetical protein [Agrobacterium vitis]
MSDISVAVLNGSTAWQSDGRVFLTRMRGRRISIWIYFKLAIMRVKNCRRRGPSATGGQGNVGWLGIIGVFFTEIVLWGFTILTGY